MAVKRKPRRQANNNPFQANSAELGNFMGLRPLTLISLRATITGKVATFGENLKRVQKAKGVSVNVLADRVKVKASVVSGWRNDRRGLPETPTVFKLAKALECSIEELLAGIDAEYDDVVRRHAILDAAEQERLSDQERIGKFDVEGLAVDIEELQKMDAEQLMRHSHQVIEEHRRLASLDKYERRFHEAFERLDQKTRDNLLFMAERLAGRVPREKPQPAARGSGKRQAKSALERPRAARS